jgi:hypothetical protein
LTFSKAFFNLPNDATGRFRRFVESGLTVKTGTLATTGLRVDSDGNMSGGGTGEGQEESTTFVDSSGKVVSTDTPRWILWQTGANHGSSSNSVC